MIPQKYFCLLFAADLTCIKKSVIFNICKDFIV